MHFTIYRFPMTWKSSLSSRVPLKAKLKIKVYLDDLSRSRLHFQLIFSLIGKPVAAEKLKRDIKFETMVFTTLCNRV